MSIQELPYRDRCHVWKILDARTDEYYERIKEKIGKVMLPNDEVKLIGDIKKKYGAHSIILSQYLLDFITMNFN